MGQARQVMTSRATIERNTQTVVDGYGLAGPPTWSVIATDVPCHYWEQTGSNRMTTRNNLREVTERDPQVIMPLSTDITAEDRISQITDRRGTILWENLWVDGVRRRADHLDVLLRHYE